jgi:geranylgeranyl reductase family protein
MRVAIIGAGPAGSMAAVRLARAGASVTLFDPSHPREKPCGGGLTGRALSLVSDVVDIASLPAVVAQSAAVEGLERSARVPLVDKGQTAGSSLLIVGRSLFDRALLEAAVNAGARHRHEKVVDVSSRGRCMYVRTELGEDRFDQLLGADGANSIVRKKLARPFTRAQLSIAAGYYVIGPTASDIAVMTTRRQPGYLWSFPRPGHLAVGICAPATHRTTSGDLRRQSAEWIEQHGLDRHSRLVPYAWPIPSIGHQSQAAIALGGPGWLLLGDAAGLVDPLTREGIYYALLSGQWAAEILTSRAGIDAALSYADKVFDEIHPELARAARLSEVFFAPAFSSLLVRALEENGAIRDVFVDLVAGVQPYRGLGRRLLATREWRLAANAIRVLLGTGPSNSMGRAHGACEVRSRREKEAMRDIADAEQR